MDFGVISLLIVLVLAVVIVLFTPEPAKSKFAEVGGVAFLLWVLVKLVGALLGKT